MLRTLSLQDLPKNTITESFCKNRCSFFWKDHKLRTRLTITNVCTSSIDELIMAISKVSTTFSDFLANKVPFYVTGLWYLIPTLLPFLPTLCSSKKKEDQDTASPLLGSDDEDDINDAINFGINIAVGIIKDAKSVVIFVEGARIADRDKSENITNWLELISGVIDIVYMIAMLANYHYAKKKLIKGKTDDIEKDKKIQDLEQQLGTVTKDSVEVSTKLDAIKSPAPESQISKPTL